MRNKYLTLVEGATPDNLPKFDIGDTVDVHVRILEGAKERIQVFGGTVISPTPEHSGPSRGRGTWGEGRPRPADAR